jgi:hypothetical protein
MKIYVVKGIVDREGEDIIVARTSRKKAEQDLDWLYDHRHRSPNGSTLSAADYRIKLKDWRAEFRSQFPDVEDLWGWDGFYVVELNVIEDPADD